MKPFSSTWLSSIGRESPNQKKNWGTIKKFFYLAFLAMTHKKRIKNNSWAKARIKNWLIIALKLVRTAEMKKDIKANRLRNVWPRQEVM
jgi:hypothetical protein